MWTGRATPAAVAVSLLVSVAIVLVAVARPTAALLRYKKLTIRHTLLPVDCGHQKIFSNRILGGNITHIGEYPWMVLLLYRKHGSGAISFSCAGSLINNRYALTAAHCVTGSIVAYKGNVFAVRLAEYSVGIHPECRGRVGVPPCVDVHEDVPVERAIPIPGYVQLQKNDIALLRLRRKVSFNDYVQPICLPTRGERSEPGTYLTVAGWGETRRTVVLRNKQKVDVAAVDQEECMDVYKPANFIIQIGHMCAGGEENEDACHGDSGGPLMRRYPGMNRWYQEGIVSIGMDCGIKDYPGIYTRITEYMDWIAKTIKP